jgi:hypothetical protein
MLILESFPNYSEISLTVLGKKGHYYKNSYGKTRRNLDLGFNSAPVLGPDKGTGALLQLAKVWS